jgi:hypothetical protein
LSLPPIAFIDFETYYDQDFSLSKLQTDEYILSPQFETILVSVKVDGTHHVFCDTDEAVICGLLHSVVDDWSKYAICCHNTMFDGFILAMRYGIKPRMWLDTLPMCKMIFPHLRSHSLANLAKFFNFPDKGGAVHNMKGKHLLDMTERELVDYIEYCKNDTDLCEMIFNEVVDRAPLLSLILIDMTIRMFTEPTFHGDKNMITNLYHAEVRRKKELMELAQIDRSEIMSNPKFAARLRALHVIPPTKISPRTEKETFAFAKTDKEFMALLEHSNPDVQALVAARTGAKTTIAETRALRFSQMADRGPLPVYLNFWGAKTTGRYSGGNKVNWQNLPARGISAGLRMALRAPPGHKVIVGDSSNIELRTVMALAGQQDALQKLSSGVDMYCDFASQLFGRQIFKTDKAERFLGKTAMLGLQYGAGAERFAEMVRVQGGPIGIEPISMNRAYEIVNLYRSLYGQVTELWRHCQEEVLPDIAAGCDHMQVDVNGWFVTQYEGFGRPGEPGVKYHNLKYDGEWSYTLGRNENIRIYGPKVVENLCQHAAMLIVMWQTAMIHQQYAVKLSVHDEAVCIEADENVEACKAYVIKSLSALPKWCRGAMPVVGEVEIGDSYGDAK